MHHRKQRNGTTTATTTTGTTTTSKMQKSDSGNDAMARLRFLKKPLCLQYMISSQCAKRHNFYKSKPKDQSLIIVLVVGVLRLFSWIDYFIRNDLWYFIITPVDELERRAQVASNTNRRARKKRLFTRDRPISYCKSRRDPWNHVGMVEWYERRMLNRQLCYA